MSKQTLLRRESVRTSEAWDLRHLDAFALRVDPGIGFEVDVVVLFTCHCFTHSFKRDVRSPLEIPGVYAVFFEVMRDKQRKRRLLLYIQSAYRLESLTHRLAKAGKVRFATLLRAAYQGRRIHG
jgi:hypothetical protein